MAQHTTTFWNYRIVQYKTGELAIHEVYYDKDGNPAMVTADDIGIMGDDMEELKADLEYHREAFNRDILLFEDI